ncbi:MAG: hypothetical protein ACD_75C01055G0001, partial [uncultured bacterium]
MVAPSIRYLVGKAIALGLVWF